MIRLAIVEDDKRDMDLLSEYLERYQNETGQEMIINRFTDGDEIVSGYKGEYDLILMDIQMRFMDGMAAAEQIRKMDEEVTLMFVTNMRQYAIRGYEVEAFDYLVKPIEYFSFSQKLGRALARRKTKESRYIYIPVEEGMQKVNIEEIRYVESIGHWMNYHMLKEVYASRGTLKDLEEMLVSYGFFRIAKGFIVNMKYVDRVQGNNCIINGDSIPISRKKRRLFMDTLLQYVDKEIW